MSESRFVHAKGHVFGDDMVCTQTDKHGRHCRRHFAQHQIDPQNCPASVEEPCRTCGGLHINRYRHMTRGKIENRRVCMDCARRRANESKRRAKVKRQQEAFLEAYSPQGDPDAPLA